MPSYLTAPLLRHRLDTDDVARVTLDPETSSSSSTPDTSSQILLGIDESFDADAITRGSNLVLSSSFSDSDDSRCNSNGYKHFEGDQEGVNLFPSAKPFVWDVCGSVIHNGRKRASRSCPDPDEELEKFNRSLFWLALDQSTFCSRLVSYSVVFLLAIVVPVCYILLVDTEPSSLQIGHPFDLIVHISEAALALISFFCLSCNLHKHGLCRFLLLDQIREELKQIQDGYSGKLTGAFNLLWLILLLSCAAELIFQIWWFMSAPVHLPFIQSPIVKRTIMCSAVMISWFYKTAVFLLPCILFRLMCYLQDLRFEDYVKMLESRTGVAHLLKQYIHLRQQLNIVSHRYRMFILLSLVVITASQFIFLLMITATSGSVSLYTAGNMGVCSVVQLIGFTICLHGAARITHKGQRIVSIVSQWHAISTCQNYHNTRKDDVEVKNNPIFWLMEQENGTEEANDLNSALNMCRTDVSTNNDIAAFHMRQAFVWYIQHDQAGISLFGYKLDRSFVYALASVELSLLLFILGLTIGID
ncbi:hypothetical protein KP509_09G054100 [Ceratopteris richardii]|uniref:Uncharacterized protein n=1 Tax=Ceratopteris richardii TaxID=49495 RepID=A0A8T2UAJ3_CERRI|nr:hypothetical protein KP509_09G054100 [Ceratopteris richardii]